MEDTATNAVWDAIAARIAAGVNPPTTPGFGRPILGPERWYPNGQAPSSAVLGYFLFGQAPEDPAGNYNQEDGESGEFTIHCWADTKPNAQREYQWLKALLQSAPLVVDGFTVTELVIRKGAETPDATSTAWQVPMVLRVETLDA
jgi:hypothetical protein